MNLAGSYLWPGSLEEAKSLQIDLATRVSHVNAIPSNPKYVAGIDVSPPDNNGWVLGSTVVLRWPELEMAEVRLGWALPPIPYIPGYLAFREIPAVIDALEKLEIRPDVILVDGQGLAHPRRFGLACHIGILTDLPTIGCAKSILLGRYDNLETSRGSSAPILHKNEVLGAAVRTKNNISPVYVSIGHKVDLTSAVATVLRSCGKYRLPETTRLAHQAAAGRYPEGVYRESQP